MTALALLALVVAYAVGGLAGVGWLVVAYVGLVLGVGVLMLVGALIDDLLH